jgi:hypothetical protein
MAVAVLLGFVIVAAAIVIHGGATPDWGPWQGSELARLLR